MASCFPAGFPAISPWRHAAWKVFTGHSTGAFGSLPNEDLQPDQAGFPRGNKPDLRTPGIVPCIDSTPPLPITTAALTSSSAVARHLGRALLLLPRRHYAYVLSSAPLPPTAVALSFSAATAGRLAVLVSIATTSSESIRSTRRICSVPPLVSPRTFSCRSRGRRAAATNRRQSEAVGRGSVRILSYHFSRSAACRQDLLGGLVVPAVLFVCFSICRIMCMQASDVVSCVCSRLVRWTAGSVRFVSS